MFICVIPEFLLSAHVTHLRATCSNTSSENVVSVIRLAGRVIVISKYRVVAASMRLCEIGL